MNLSDKNEEFGEVIVGCASCMGDLLKRIRTRKLNMSQLAFGNQCGISQRMISYMERMDSFRHFSMIQLFRVAYGIGVLPSDLLNYVESVMTEKEPKLMRPFYKNRHFYERLRRRWMMHNDANSTRLFEALRETLELFRKERPSDISDEDIEEIRRILG